MMRQAAAGHPRTRLRLGARTPGIRRSSRFATLALGIGANTAMFSIVERGAAAAAAVRDADRLVAVWARTPTQLRAALVSSPKFDTSGASRAHVRRARGVWLAQEREPHRRRASRSG